MTKYTHSLCQVLRLLLVKSLQLCSTLRFYGLACQAPLSIGFSRQEYSPPPGDFPYLGIEPISLKSPALGGGFFITGATWEALSSGYFILFFFFNLLDCIGS